MPEIYNHKCIKCSTQYQDTDPEDYYCLSCKEVVKKIAKEVDKKLARVISKKPVKSDLQLFDERSKKYRGISFISANDLGL